MKKLNFVLTKIYFFRRGIKDNLLGYRGLSQVAEIIDRTTSRATFQYQL